MNQKERHKLVDEVYELTEELAKEREDYISLTVNFNRYSHDNEIKTTVGVYLANIGHIIGSTDPLEKFRAYQKKRDIRFRKF